MVDRTNNHCELNSHDDNSQLPIVDYGRLSERLDGIERHLAAIADQIAKNAEAEPTVREYYSVQEFAELVGKKEYTVREWCRFSRIHAEKCESGHGEYQRWKIPAEEFQRYQNHGLLPNKYPSKFFK